MMDVHPVLPKDALYSLDLHPAVARLVMERDLNRSFRWPLPLAEHPLCYLLNKIPRPMVIGGDCSTFCDAEVAASVGSESVALGTLKTLDVDAIRGIAVPFSLVRNGEPVDDEDLCNGLEIPASKISLDLELDGWFRPKEDIYFIATNLQKKLFPTQPVKLVLNKLALFENQGHFKPHHSSTSAGSPVATLLIACKAAEAKESDNHFVLYVDGEELRYDLSARSWIAFYNDIEYALSPVTSGVRVILQLDIYSEDETTPRPHTVGFLPAPSSPIFTRQYGYRPYNGEDTYWEDSLRRVDTFYIQTISDNPNFALPAPTQKFVTKLLALLQRAKDNLQSDTAVKKSAPRTVAFLLDHFYRQRSIQPDHLKGADKGLYRALKAAAPDVNILLHPVTYTAEHLRSENYKFELKQYLELSPPFDGNSRPFIPKPIMFLHRWGALALRYGHSENNWNNGAREITDKYFTGAIFVTLFDQLEDDVDTTKNDSLNSNSVVDLSLYEGDSDNSDDDSDDSA